MPYIHYDGNTHGIKDLQGLIWKVAAEDFFLSASSKVTSQTQVVSICGSEKAYHQAH